MAGIREGKVPIHQIVCIDEKGGIGKNGDLPWKIQKDWQHFLQLSLRIDKEDTKKTKVCWILGRESFQLHSQKDGLFEELKKSHQIIKIVMSRRWTEIPEEYKNTDSQCGK